MLRSKKEEDISPIVDLQNHVAAAQALLKVYMSGFPEVSHPSAFLSCIKESLGSIGGLFAYDECIDKLALKSDFMEAVCLPSKQMKKISEDYTNFYEKGLFPLSEATLACLNILIKHLGASYTGKIKQQADSLSKLLLEEKTDENQPEANYRLIP